MINLPQITPISQSLLRAEQGSLASLQGKALQQKTDQSQTLRALKMKGINDPKARAIAIQLDPEYGKQLQEFQAQQQEFEAKRAIYWGGQAQAASTADLALRPAHYKRLYEQAEAAGEDVNIFPLPSDKWTDAHQETLEYISQSSIPAKNQLEAQQKERIAQQKLAAGVDDPADVRSYKFVRNLPKKEQEEFKSLKRDVYKFALTTDDEGKVIPMAGAEAAKEAIKSAEARGTGLGKAEALTIEEIKSQESKLPNLMKVVDELSSLSKIATYTKVGIAKDSVLRQTGQKMSKGGIARARYIAMVDNQVLPLLRDTFGAQFTVEEGKSLRATLGDPDKTPLEKQEVLDAFIAQKIRNLEAAKKKLTINPRGTISPYQEGQTATNPSTGQTLTYTGGKWQ